MRSEQGKSRFDNAIDKWLEPYLEECAKARYERLIKSAKSSDYAYIHGVGIIELPPIEKEV